MFKKGNSEVMHEISIVESKPFYYNNSKEEK